MSKKLPKDNLKKVSGAGAPGPVHRADVASKNIANKKVAGGQAPFPIPKGEGPNSGSGKNVTFGSDVIL